MKNNRSAGEAVVGLPPSALPTNQQKGVHQNGKPMVLKKQPIKNAFNTPFGNYAANAGSSNDNSSLNDDDG